MFKPLFIYVEGADDHRFVERIISPLLVGTFSKVFIIPYSQKSSKVLKEHLKATKATCASCQGAYWFLVDKDDRPCITNTKEWLRDAYSLSNLELERVIVVIREIEAWYLAGHPSLHRSLHMNDTDGVTKEVFDHHSKRLQFATPAEYMLELLNDFSLEDARRQSQSLAYYLNKLSID